MVGAVKSLLVTCFIFSTNAVGIAQTVSPLSEGQTGVPAWMENWSPLTVRGDLPREIATAQVSTMALLFPAARIGLFWTAGNPSASLTDIADNYSEVSAGKRTVMGTYRRPLDPNSASTARLSGFGWQTRPSQSSVIGGVTLERETQNPSSLSDINKPYASTPFILTDSTTSAVQQTRVRLEGANGWQLKHWALGLSVGYDTRQATSLNASFVRRNRQITPAGSVGISRFLRNQRLQVGARAVWSRTEETVNLNEVGGEGLLTLLQGYGEVSPTEIQNNFYRRISNEVRGAGLGLASRTGNTRWVVLLDRFHRRERTTSEQRDDPDTDLWATQSTVVGAAAQRGLFRDQGLMTIELKSERVDGSSAQVHPGRSGFNSHESETRGTLEIRASPSTWLGLVRFSFAATDRARIDSTASIRTDIHGTSPALNVEIGNKVRGNIGLFVGYSVLTYSGGGTIPAAISQSPLYQKVFAPELDMATTGALSQAVRVAGRWRKTNRARLSLTGAFSTTSGRKDGGTLAPMGNRRTADVRFSVELLQGH